MLLLLGAMSLLAPAALADAARSQAELVELRHSINALLARLADERAQAQSLGGEVEGLERQLSDLLAQRRAEMQTLRQSKAVQVELDNRLRALAAQQREYRDDLAKLVRASYLLGRESALKLLLGQRDPAQTARALTIFRYLSQARQRRLETGAALQHELTAARAESARQQQRLEQSLHRLAQNQTQLDAKRAARERSLAAIRAQMREGRAQVGRFQRREQELAQLLVQLRRRKPAVDATRNVAAAQVADVAEQIIADADTNTDTNTNTDVIADTNAHANTHTIADTDADTNTDTNTNTDANTDAPSTDPPRARFALAGFQQSKGELSAPVAGRVAARFGQPRPESGLAWQGLMLEAAEGAEVVAIYSGQVVFSDWFRGYGQLLVLDHGDGYMSLYGHNRALRASIGAAVEAGDSIGEVGSTGGLDRPGLYFEIRHNGEPRDPLDWCRI